MIKPLMKLMVAFIGVTLLLSPADVSAGAQEESIKLFDSAKSWSPLWYSNDFIMYIDPYSVFKIHDEQWDVNLTTMNNSNNYNLLDTFTYRIRCNDSTWQKVGWRVDGVFRSYRGPLGISLGSYEQPVNFIENTIISPLKEQVCGRFFSGSRYYWAYSSFRDSQIRGPIDQIWIKNNKVEVSQEDINLRHVYLMFSVLGGTQANFGEMFARCNSREIINVVDGVPMSDWTSVISNSAIDVLFEKMCSQRFSYITYQNDQITLPTLKISSQPVQAIETSETTRLETELDEAKQKCAGLGFRTGTPKYGQCVLKLSQ